MKVSLVLSTENIYEASKITNLILEQAYIWSSWGECDASTCLQRRTRRCKEGEVCPGSGTTVAEDHPDYVPEGSEKFDRRCSDHSDCFAEATNQLPDGK